MDNGNYLSEEYKQLEPIINEVYQQKHLRPEFIPGISRIPVNGRVFDENEIKILVSASLDFWLTDGEYSEKFSFANLYSFLLKVT